MIDRGVHDCALYRDTLKGKEWDQTKKTGRLVSKKESSLTYQSPESKQRG